MKLFPHGGDIVGHLSAHLSPHANSSVGSRVNLANNHFLGLSAVDAAAPGDEPYPVSSTILCVISLTILYFAIYTTLAIVRTYGQLRYDEPQRTPALKMCEVATQTVNCAPMLCVLFVATRMRAVQLSLGESEPQVWVQISMQVSTCCVLMQSILVILLPTFTGEVAATDDQGNVDHRHARKMTPFAAVLLMTIRYLTMFGLYGGFVGVIVGACTMQGPSKFWPNGSPPVSAAVSSTIQLSVLYFSVYLLLGCVRTWDQLHGRETSKEQRTLKLAQFSVQFAPMLCVLFIGARMRALQIDPKDGHPQHWAQYCFYMCTYSLVVQTVLVILAPFLSPKKGDIDGSIEFDVNEGTWVILATALRYCVMLALYGGFTAVIFSTLTIHAVDGKTPALHATMRCVVMLTVQFFAVYLMLWIAITYRELSGSPIPIIIKTLESARVTVQFCPMLSILCVAARLRALQITDQKGSPQLWAQDSMYFSNYALLIQLTMCLLLPCFSGEAAQLDQAGNVIFKSQNPVAEVLLTFVRYAALIALYGGIAFVCTSLFFLTKNTAVMDQ